MHNDDLSDWAGDTARSLAAVGLDAVGVADGAPYQDVLEGCRSVIVFGSGGRTLWNALVADISRNPAHLTGELHPLDAFVLRTLDRVDPDPGPSRRWVRCAGDETTFVDFRGLAVAAGLGWVGRLGLVMNPTFGPWMGLRAACFTTEAIPFAGPLPGGGPCDGCPAPCEPACPVGAVTEAGWNVARCAAYHHESDECLGVCHSRNACPEGAEHAHGALEHHYHADRRTGRRQLAASLGIEDDGIEGIGPFWGEWSADEGGPDADSTGEGTSG